MNLVLRVFLVASFATLAVSGAAQEATLAPAPANRPKHLTLAAIAEPARAAAGAKVSLMLDVTPNPKIHVYAPGAKDYVQVALTLTPQTDIKPGAPKYPKPEDFFFAPLNEHVPVYDKPFRITHDVTLGARLKPGTTVTVTGTLAYQACDDTICFIPMSAPVAWTISVGK